MDIYEEYIENVIQLAEDAMYDGRYEEAKRLFESGLIEEPGYPKLHAKLGDMYHYHHINLALAERHYQLALHFKPDYKEIYEELTTLYLDHKKYEGIKALMKKAIKVDCVDKAFVHEKLGMVEEALGNYKEAIQHYRKGLFASLDNDNVDELKRHIKRNKYKRIKNRWKSWQREN